MLRTSWLALAVAGLLTVQAGSASAQYYFYPPYYPLQQYNPYYFQPPVPSAYLMPQIGPPLDYEQMRVVNMALNSAPLIGTLQSVNRTVFDTFGRRITIRATLTRYPLGGWRANVQLYTTNRFGQTIYQVVQL